MISIFVRRLAGAPDHAPDWILSLTAEERTRSRLHCTTDEGQAVYLQLPRGTILQEGNWLEAQTGQTLQIRAKPEPVMTVNTAFPLALLQAAYHLGNRHVPLEITANYLRLSPDPVLRDLLEHRGLTLLDEIAPFQPETGAYSTSDHAHPHNHHH
ncbi:MAG: urease accessory protein UreE [Synechococcales bacterium]|nr:urease accessory protein UreE [Synechococcales bacterium]